MLIEGVERSDIEDALGRLLDDIEARIAGSGDGRAADGERLGKVQGIAC